MIESQMTREELLALPVSVDLPTAGRAFGLGRTKSYDLARQGDFPCKTIRVGGGKYRVPRSSLFAALDIADEGAMSQAADPRPAA